MNTIVGKIATCGQPYLVSGILIGKYDNPNTADNQGGSLLRANRKQKCDKKIFYAEENVSVFCNKVLTWRAKVGKN